MDRGKVDPKNAQCEITRILFLPDSVFHKP